MSRAWIIDLLDRELPGWPGSARDALAEKIVEALPVHEIAAAVKTSALATLMVVDAIGHDCRPVDLAQDIGNQAAMSVVERLTEIDEDEQPEGTSVQ